jgi:hypothetical protein
MVYIISQLMFLNVFNTGSCVVVTRKGGQAFRLASSNDKNMRTILACISADGRHMPMHTVYKGRRKQHSWLQGGPTGATYDCSESGWMEANNFYKWFAEVIVPSVQHLDGTKLLLFDGHSSHVSLELIDKARENNIVLFKLIAHSSHILQPLDYGVFSPAKVAWKKSLDKHFKDNGLVDVSNADFPGLMKNVYDKAFKPEHALKGFEACGIFPLNREKITDES